MKLTKKIINELIQETLAEIAVQIEPVKERKRAYKRKRMVYPEGPAGADTNYRPKNQMSKKEYERIYGEKSKASSSETKVNVQKEEKVDMGYNKRPIQKGETLSGISAEYGDYYDMDKILKHNPQIKDPNKIKTGGTLNIPKSWSYGRPGGYVNVGGDDIYVPSHHNPGYIYAKPPQISQDIYQSWQHPKADSTLTSHGHKRKNENYNYKQVMGVQSLTEGKRRQLEIPVMDKIKTDKILKSMRMKYGKHYDIGVGKRNSFILDVDVKYLDKLLSLLMKYRVRVR